MPPGRLGLLLPVAEGPQTEVEHPLRFSLLSRDEPNDILVQPFLYDFCMYVRSKAELILLLCYLTDKFILLF